MNEPNGSPPIINLCLSISSAFFAWITIKDVQVIVTLIATIVSIVTSMLAGAYYYKKIKTKSYEKDT